MTNSNRIFGKKRKPWHVESAITDLHKQMKTYIGQWLDAFYIKNAPPSVAALLEARDAKGLEWVKEQGYHYDHKSIRHISDTSFAMEFILYKGEATRANIVSQFDFEVVYDGTKFLDPHALAAMIFVGTTPTSHKNPLDN